MAIKGKELVEKRNVLNEVRKNNMSLQELRFFSIYLSKINARDTSTRVVRFPLCDFQKIMEIGSDINITHFKLITDRLLGQIVSIPAERGGYTSFQLFKECTVTKDENEEWYVEIDAHDKALPLMFDFKDKYFTYELWNALRLKSVNQLRMYELLKQFETVGQREISIEELKTSLGISPKEYDRFERFRVRVLNSCQQALQENTDIRFTYERGKTGKGGKWLTIIFHIFKNENHKDQLTLNQFIKEQKSVREISVEDIPLSASSEREERTKICFGFEADIFDEFTTKELTELFEIAWNVVPDEDVERHKESIGDLKFAKECAVSDYIKSKIRYCNAYKKPIPHRYAFIKKAVAENWK